MKLILASQSKRRQHVLADAGYQFEVVVSNVDEQAIRHDDPVELVKQLALAKAEVVAKNLNEPALVIGADTVVMFHGKLREKPTSTEEARAFLESYRNSVVSAVHGVAVVKSSSGAHRVGTDSADTHFGDIPDEMINQLIDSTIVFEWAGGYYPADPLLAPCITQVVAQSGTTSGLPLHLVHQFLKELA